MASLIEKYAADLDLDHLPDPKHMPKRQENGAIERVLSMSGKGINGFYTKKVKLQQLNLFEHFKIGDTGAFAF